jgi:RNA polymerase sigma-70 factor (ECF subfamily)
MKTLIKACKQGQSSAFEQIYKRYSKAMYNICLRMLVVKEDAEDILQESFISAFSKIDQFAEQVEFGAWLRSIVIRKCIDALRKKKILTLDIDTETITEPESIENTDDPDYTVDDIHLGLQELPTGYRVVMVLFLFESLSHKQIAEQLGISEGTSKSQYARGKKKLIEVIANKKENESHAR